MDGILPTYLLELIQKNKNIRKAIAFRMQADSEPKLTKETGFHKKTSKLTRNFIDYNGYWLANNYTDYGTVSTSIQPVEKKQLQLIYLH